MFNYNPYSDRRILNFPAIHPCPSISPSTLLASLADLTSEISGFRCSRFPIFRRSIREFLREASILSAFFDNLQACGSHMPESAIARLLDVHVALQKLRWLLSDCARRGARLWMLMNHRRLLSEFRVVARSISISLDVVEKSTLRFDEDVKEMIGLLAKQSREVEIRIDFEDDRTVRAVRSILNDNFRSGVSPSPTDLRWVLDRLDVKNWEDCNEEVAFLEEEVLENSAGEDDDDAALVNSLMRFMIYCRVALFQVDEAKPKGDQRCRCQPRGFETLGLNPESFRCPISLELMTDPVTISTGQTYDRASIVRWFKDGHRICPVTGETLMDLRIVPNSTLQRLVFPQASLNGNYHKKRDLTKTLFPPSTSAVKAARMTVAFLVDKLSRGSGAEKNRAAYEIRLLTRSNLFHRVCLVEADSVPWLLHLFSSPDPSTQDNAVAALLNLSKVAVGKTAISDIGGVKLVVDAIKQGLKVEAQQNAAAILFYLSSVDEYRQEIGEFPEAIPALANLLRTGTYRAKKNAAVALSCLLSFPGNQYKALSTGVVSALIDLLTDEREDLVNDCVGVLAKIAESKEGTDEILKSSSDMLPRVVQVLQSATLRSGKEYSISLMLSLFENSGQKMISQSETLPLLMPSLYSMVVDGPPQASKNARLLINHIHMIYDQDYPVSASPRPTVEDHRAVCAL